MHGLNVFHFNTVNTIDSCDDAVLVALQMLEVVRQSLHENFKFTIVHGFDDKFPVVGKEEEAAGFSLAFSCFKCLVPISLSG